MTVTKTSYAPYTTLYGTLAEVVGALQAEVVPAHKVIAIYYDSTLTVHIAVYHK